MASSTRNKRNKFLNINYLDVDSRMPAPPEYWLQRLYDFDDKLVLFPSISTPFAYVLARKATRTGGMNQRDPQFANAMPDTKFCVERHLLPVSLITRHSSASWSIDNILNDLRQRDIWAAGGAEKFADRVDAGDAAEEARLKKQVRDDMNNRGSAAWLSYQLRSGAAVAASGTAAQAARRDKGSVHSQPTL